MCVFYATFRARTCRERAAPRHNAALTLNRAWVWGGVRQPSNSLYKHTHTHTYLYIYAVCEVGLKIENLGSYFRSARHMLFLCELINGCVCVCVAVVCVYAGSYTHTHTPIYTVRRGHYTTHSRRLQLRAVFHQQPERVLLLCVCSCFLCVVCKYQLYSIQLLMMMWRRLR